MAKKQETKYKYPSRFGSHKSMINQEATDKLNMQNVVVCTDEYGDYMTFNNMLDTGLVDWHRADGNRVKYEKESRKS